MNTDIYETLKDRILFLDHEPGQILKEKELADTFGVSRTPLRTVLVRLEWEHLLKIMPRTGVMVMPLELNTITNVFQARLEIESVIGTMAAQRFTADHHAELDALQIECTKITDTICPRTLGTLDIEIKRLFHRAIANPFLIEMSERLYALSLRLWVHNMNNMDLAEWRNEVTCLTADLQELSLALTAESPARVGEIRKAQLLKHLKRIRSKFLGL